VISLLKPIDTVDKKNSENLEDGIRACTSRVRLSPSSARSPDLQVRASAFPFFSLG